MVKEELIKFQKSSVSGSRNFLKDSSTLWDGHLFTHWLISPSPDLDQIHLGLVYYYYYEVPWERMPYLSTLEVCWLQGAIQSVLTFTFTFTNQCNESAVELKKLWEHLTAKRRLVVAVLSVVLNLPSKTSLMADWKLSSWLPSAVFSVLMRSRSRINNMAEALAVWELLQLLMLTLLMMKGIAR